jgi:hypothetical protein
MLTLHQRRTHPEYVEDCFGCKVGSLTVSAAVELRVQNDGNYRWAHKMQREERDMDAYRRLRREGHQPPHIAGCARLEARADHPYEVTRGKLYPGEAHRKLKEAMTLMDDQGFNPTVPQDQPIEVEQ